MATGKAEVDWSEVEQALQKVDNAANHNPKTMEVVALLLEQFVRNTFRDQTDPWGLPWPEWADRKALLAARRRMGYKSVAKLQASMHLFDSIHHHSEDTSAEVVEGEGLIYAPVQQFGNVHIPPRPSFPMRSPNDLQFPDPWLRVVFAPIVTAMNEAVK